jgi:hypothetical protein
MWHVLERDYMEELGVDGTIKNGSSRNKTRRYGLD